MCNANKHPAGCQCGFGPPYPNVGVTVRKLLKMGDRQSSTVAELDLSFPLPKTNYFDLIDRTGRDRVLATTAKALQSLADKRFGEGSIKVVPTRVKKGSIEVSVSLVVAAVAAYKFFKDYEALRKGVSLFTKDIGYGSRKLYQVVKKRYLNEERRSLKKAKIEKKQIPNYPEKEITTRRIAENTPKKSLPQPCEEKGV